MCPPPPAAGVGAQFSARSVWRWGGATPRWHARLRARGGVLRCEELPVCLDSVRKGCRAETPVGGAQSDTTKKKKGIKVCAVSSAYHTCPDPVLNQARMLAILRLVVNATCCPCACACIGSPVCANLTAYYGRGHAYAHSLGGVQRNERQGSILSGFDEGDTSV